MRIFLTVFKRQKYEVNHVPYNDGVMIRPVEVRFAIEK